MGYRYLDILMPTDYKEAELKEIISKKLKLNDFDYSIERKSLDARNKNKISWTIRAGVISDEIKSGIAPQLPSLEIPKLITDKKVIVVGSGPAGFFSAYVLQLAGFNTTIIEQGAEVTTRIRDINKFEKTGDLNETSNYAFGEGGAGTFSDGKLTARSKRIKSEKQFIFKSYIEAGAPEEIAYLSHPHIGTDNLKMIVVNLRKKYQEIGGNFLFNTQFKSLSKKNVSQANVVSIETNKGVLAADYFIFATGHSSYQSYRALIQSDVGFKTKPFAIGTRVEHSQRLINKSQWGTYSLPGVKAAEYKLSNKSKNLFPVYSFCMCPGGKVVPAAPYKELCVVNGMSKYKRDGKFANAGIVAGLDLNDLLGKNVSPLEALEWVEKLERDFYNVSKSFAAPACKIKDFLNKRNTPKYGKTAYPFRLVEADFRSLLPSKIIDSIEQGLRNFTKKIKGFEDGIMIGLESKTSSPIQVLREQSGLVNGFNNLYMVGEGSGFAGGIISSAADGIKAALNIISE